WRRCNDLDVAHIELVSQRGELVLVEFVLHHKLLDRTLVNHAARLGFVQKFVRVDAQFLLTSLSVVRRGRPKSGPSHRPHNSKRRSGCLYSAPGSRPSREASVSTSSAAK